MIEFALVPVAAVDCNPAVRNLVLNSRVGDVKSGSSAEKGNMIAPRLLPRLHASLELLVDTRLELLRLLLPLEGGSDELVLLVDLVDALQFGRCASDEGIDPAWRRFVRREGLGESRQEVVVVRTSGEEEI